MRNRCIALIAEAVVLEILCLPAGRRRPGRGVLGTVGKRSAADGGGVCRSDSCHQHTGIFPDNKALLREII